MRIQELNNLKIGQRLVHFKTDLVIEIKSEDLDFDGHKTFKCFAVGIKNSESTLSTFNCAEWNICENNLLVRVQELEYKIELINNRLSNIGWQITQ